jgi:phosphoribosyl-dephospho-CoA transferase
VTRDQKLARYRHLREINAGQQTRALDHIASDTILEYGRRLGVAHGRTLVCDSASEMTLLFDLAVYTGKAGRSRGIERYARSVGPTLTGDEAMMLRAAQAAQFRIWRVERPHEIAGLWVVDIILGDTMWLIDEGLEASCRTGLVFAGRLMAAEDFVMTCGVSVPLSVTLLAAAMDNMPNMGSASGEDLLNDPRFAVGIYRSAIETGTMERMQFVDSDALALALALEVESVD